MHQNYQQKLGAMYKKDLLFDSMFSESCKRLERIQRRASQMIKRMENGTSEERLKGL